MNVLKIIRSFHISLGSNLVVNVCHPYLGSSQLNQTDFFFLLPSFKAGYNLQGLARSSQACYLVVLKINLKCKDQGSSVFTV